MPTKLTTPSDGTEILTGADDARPRRNRLRWVPIGFYFALGVVLLLILAYFARLVLTATLNVLMPFVLGGILALLVDPLVIRLQRLVRIPRGPAAALVFAILLLLLIGFIAVVIPALVSQATALTGNAPSYIERIKDLLGAFLKHHHKIASITLPKSVSALQAMVSAKIGQFLQNSSGDITAFLIGSLTMIVQLFLSLIVTLFLMIDLDRLRARLMFLAPANWRVPIKHYSNDIGDVFSDYVRGLIIVCALYGVGSIILLYGLSLVHHSLAQYALLVGVLSGILYAVPYLGSITTTVLIFLVGFASGGAGFGGIAVACSLALNQIFDNIVTPKVVGGGVGLHPVIALFALLLGGELFGVWGMLLSVPVAASIQVVLFRLYPKTNMPTPDFFLRAQGIPQQQREALKVDAGQDSPTSQAKLD